MAAQGTFFAALLLCLSAVTHAKEETPESRLFFDSDVSATLPMTSILSIGALAIGLLLLVAIFTFIGGETKEALSYAAPTSYAASAPSYSNEESSYSILRSINEASDRYQWEQK